MNDIELKTWEFLSEIKELNKINNGRSFEISLKANLDTPKDFKCSIIDMLYKNGAVEILDEYFGNAVTKEGKKVPIAKGAPLRMFGHKPIEITIRIKEPLFNKIYTNYNKQNGKKQNDTIKYTYYESGEGLLKTGFKDIHFSGTTGLILYFLYQNRNKANGQDFKTYNDSITKDYSDKHQTGSVIFRHSIEDINKRVEKETNGLISNLIEKINNGNKSNKYSWNPKIKNK